MKPPKLLFINACGSLEGDISIALLALANLRPGAFEVTAVSVPRGRVYEKLCAMPRVRVLPMELGGSEARPPGRTAVGHEVMETLRALPRLCRLISRERIDVIYTIDRTVAAHVAQLTSRLTRRPFVLCAAYPFYPKDALVNRVTLRQATRVQVHSDYLRAHLEPYCRSPDRLVKIADAVQIEDYDACASGADVRRGLGIAPDAPVVVLAGRVDRYKGHEDLIGAAVVVLRQRPETHFLIAGRAADPTFRDHLRGMIDRHGVAGNVRLLGYHPDLSALMAAADIIAMPSWEEPFGLVALEGMAVGKPIVATQAGGVPEFVLHGEVGLLVPPRDPRALAGALLDLIGQPERASAMGERGRKRVEQFHSARAFADGVAAMLFDVLPHERRPEYGRPLRAE